MAAIQDSSIGIGVETTYNTGVTPNRFYEYTAETFAAGKNTVQSAALRTGTRGGRTGRRVVVAADPGGDFTIECASKGMGLLWQAALGGAASTLVSGSTYQQVITPAATLNSYTVQKGLVDATGTVRPFTYTGGMVNAWQFALGNQGIATLQTTWDCAAVTTATAYATPSYPAEPVHLYAFTGGSIYTGTLTNPTTIALASATTSIADVRSFNLSGNNNLAVDRRKNLGAISKPTTGNLTVTGSVDVEFDAMTWSSAVLNDTPMALVLNLIGGSLSTGTETLQIVIPNIVPDNDLPQTNGMDLITTTINFTALIDSAGDPLMSVVLRTADTAL